MIAIIVNILLMFVWILIGRFYWIFPFSAIFYPILFILSGYVINYNLSGFVVVPMCFIVILTNDYLTTIYGPGDHDQVGTLLCELSFYATLFFTTITLFFVMINCTRYTNSLGGVSTLGFMQIIRDIGFVLVCALTTFLFYRYITYKPYT